MKIANFAKINIEKKNNANNYNKLQTKIAMPNCHFTEDCHFSKIAKKSPKIVATISRSDKFQLKINLPKLICI